MSSHSKHRVYIPTNARSNQYLLAEIKTDESFYQHFDDAKSCYEQLSQRFFALTDAAGLRNVHMIANDKLPVVRYHVEATHFQTARQILFFYDPLVHEGQNLFITPDYQARKIRLLFLATGPELRAHAAQFHQQVMGVIAQLKAEPSMAEHRVFKHYIAGIPNVLNIAGHRHFVFNRRKPRIHFSLYCIRPLFWQAPIKISQRTAGG